MEKRAPPSRRFCATIWPAVRFDQLPRDGKAEARARPARCRDRDKTSRRLCSSSPGGEPGPLIGHGEDQHVASSRATLTSIGLFGLGVGRGIGEQRRRAPVAIRARIDGKRRQIFGDDDFTRVFQSGQRDCFTQQFARIAPLAHRLEKSRLQTRRIQQMIDGAGEAPDGLLQFGAIRLRLLQRGGHGGERCFQFVRNRIEERLLQFLRLTRDLRRAALFQGALLVHEERELRGKGVEQLALLDRGQMPSGGRVSTPSARSPVTSGMCNASASGSVSVDFPAACFF